MSVRHLETVKFRVKNVFEIMSSQRQLCKPRLPERIVEKNKKDQLFNDLIALLDSKGLKWAEGEVNSGKVSLLPSHQFCGILMDTRTPLQVVAVSFQICSVRSKATMYQKCRSTVSVLIPI